jgi:hypothetical protein
MKLRNAWFGRGLGANSTVLGLAAPVLCLRTMRDAVALGAQRREAARRSRSTLLDLVLVAGALRPSLPACPAEEAFASSSVVALAGVAAIVFEACELGSRSASLNSSLSPSTRCIMGVETVGKGHMRLPTYPVIAEANTTMTATRARVGREAAPSCRAGVASSGARIGYKTLSATRTRHRNEMTALIVLARVAGGGAIVKTADPNRDEDASPAWQQRCRDRQPGT